MVYSISKGKLEFWLWNYLQKKLAEIMPLATLQRRLKKIVQMVAAVGSRKRQTYSHS